MMQAVWLGTPLCHPSVSKEYSKGCVIISRHHSLGLPGLTFKQKDVKEEDAALLLSPHVLCTDTDRLWKPSQMTQCHPLPALGLVTLIVAVLTTTGQQETASLLSPSWSETALVIAVEQEWISAIFCFTPERERGQIYPLASFLPPEHELLADFTVSR